MWLACSPESSTLYLFVSGRLWSGAPVTGSEKSWEWGDREGDVFVPGEQLCHRALLRREQPLCV